MNKFWFLMIFTAVALHAQVNNPTLIFVSTPPTGSCVPPIAAQMVVSTGLIYTCQDGTWAEIGGNTSGVQSFSAGNLSPLFTTSVANSTSNPALSFNASSANANTVLGNCTTSAGAPSYCFLTGPMLPVFTSTAGGAVPPSGGALGTFLQADGSWVSPVPGGVGTVQSVNWATGGLPSWLTGSVQNPTTTVQLSLGATSSQTANEVIGTCGSGTNGFSPCSITSAMLPVFSGSVPSAVPTSTGSTSTFLRGDGTWVAPSGISYPPAGIPNSTGSAWGSSYTTSGTGSTVALTGGPTFTTVTANSYIGQFSPIYGTIALGSGSGATIEKTVSDATAVIVASQNTATTGTGDYFDTKDSGGTLHTILDHSMGMHATTFNGIALATSGSATTYLDGTGKYSTPAGGGNVGTGGLTTGYIPVASASTTISNSNLQDVSGILIYGGANGMEINGTSQSSMLSLSQETHATSGTQFIPVGGISLSSQCWTGSASGTNSWVMQPEPNGASASAGSRILLVNSSACDTGGEYDFVLSADGTNFIANNTRITSSGGLETDSGLDGLRGSVSATVGAGAGTGGSVILDSADSRHSGKITVTTGAGPTVNSTIVTLTFNPVYSYDSYCTFSPTPTTLSVAGASLVGIFGGYTDHFNLSSGSTALGANTNLQWTYTC